MSILLILFDCFFFILLMNLDSILLVSYEVLTEETGVYISSTPSLSPLHTILTS